MRWLATILIAASFLRYASLSDRPMHADEAILADRLGTLLQSATFQYDPSDYHGPVLPYASLPFAWVSGAASYASLNETILRAVPACAGLFTVGFSWFIGLAVSGRRAAVFCALFTALSPGLVYFSRYYIPEQLLVCLSAGLLLSLIRYSQSPESNIRLRWAIAAGLFAGLMYATKETAVLALAACGISLAGLRPRVRPAHVAVAALTALAFAALAYTPGALIKSFQSFSTYTARAFGPELHAHPERRPGLRPARSYHDSHDPRAQPRRDTPSGVLGCPDNPLFSPALQDTLVRDGLSAWLDPGVGYRHR
jgi:uncharacterized protein (TIGR03663 family)